LKHVVRFLLGRSEDCREDLYTLIIPESAPIAREKREKREYSENILSSKKLIFNQKLILWARAPVFWQKSSKNRLFSEKTRYFCEKYHLSTIHTQY
jgi:hypothetical protein